jgi:hypothetical protein
MGRIQSALGAGRLALIARSPARQHNQMLALLRSRLAIAGSLLQRIVSSRHDRRH